MSGGSEVQENAPQPRFYTVNEAAAILRTSKMTLYRSIAANNFPAVRIRNRIVVPAKAIEEMEATALATRAVVDAADWVNTPTSESEHIQRPIL